jgi:hypothetical protein
MMSKTSSPRRRGSRIGGMTVLAAVLFLVRPLGAQDFRPPQKIITPNGSNPTLNFKNVASNTTINIYDENGRQVRHMQGVPAWDGKDQDGEVVESGVYIYQINDGGGNMVNGIVAVAK